MISKETLMAYVDGELDDQARSEVEAAMMLDPQIAHEVERQQMLRGRLRSSFDDVLNEPIPERLLAAVRNTPAATTGSTVTSLSDVRAAKPGKAPQRWALPQWAAMAACLVVGLFLGQQWWRSSPPPFFATKGGLVVARGDLANALSNQLSDEQDDAGPVRIGFSFRDKAGVYCRVFVMHNDNSLAGLACREQQDWRMQVLAQAAAQDGAADYRMAETAFPDSVLQAAQERIAGEPLKPAGEAAARDRQWR